MDTDKTQKNEPEAIDVNNVMNKLVNKVALVVGDEASPQRKDLVEIRDLLVELKDVDKTLSYNLLPDTVSNIQKALTSIRVSDPERLKEAEVVGDATAVFDKLPPEEIPETDEQAKQKFNQIINSQLDSTIKTVNEVIVMADAVKKSAIETPKGKDSIDKVLNEVLIGLLGDRLKQLNDVFLPEENLDKNSNEFEINPNIAYKNYNVAYKDTTTIEKTETPVEDIPETEVKVPRRIGEFPEYVTKQQRDTPSSSESTEKAQQEIGDSVPPTEKAQQEIGDAVPPTEKAQQEIGDAETGPADKNAIDVAELEAPAAPKESLAIGDAVDTTAKDLNVVGRAGTEGEKPRHPERWYERLFFQSPNAIGVNNFSAFGGTFGTGGGGFAAGVGGTLAFFAVNLADITRYVVKGIRAFNTIANGLEITTTLIAIESEREFLAAEFGAPKSPRSDANSSLSEEATFAAARKNLNDKDTARRLAINEGPTSPANIVDYLSTKLTELAEERVVTDLRNDDRDTSTGPKGSFGSTNTIIKNYDKPGEDLPYATLFKERTYRITGMPRSTGFMKIYLKRGPKFVNSQEDMVLIPFQFEPKISGDAKSADYQSLSTLGRSQGSQSYRRSQERTITLELRYLVTGPAMDVNRPEIKDVVQSKSALGMELWDEEYVYTYIVRNLRNLALPNISDPSYRIGPPIVQVWYGGISERGASTGQGNSGVVDSNNSMLNDIHPAFRTNWFSWSSGGYAQHSYRSLWVCKSVSFDYQGGVVSRVTRNTVQVTAQVQLTEIAPSVSDNEPLVWRRLTRG